MARSVSQFTDRSVSMSHSVRCLSVVGLVMSGAVPSLAAGQGAVPPAFEAPIEFSVRGATVRGRIYVAPGAELHPTIVEFKGSPGQPDGWIASFAPRQGFNGVWVDFRGQRLSDGLFDPGHTVEDAASLVALLRTERARREWRVDPDRLILVGASSGTLAALRTASDDPRIRCVAAIVPFNWGLVGRLARTDTSINRQLTEAMTRIALDSEANARYTPGIVDRVKTNAEEWNAELPAGALRGKVVFLAGAKHDATAPIAFHFTPLPVAARAGAALSVTDTLVDDGHSLSQTWQTVLVALWHWARTACLANIP